MKFREGKCQVLHLGRNNPMNCSVQGLTGLTGKGWRFWWTASRRWGISVPLQYRRLVVPWAALGGVLPAGQRRWSRPSIQHWWDISGILCPVLGFPVQEIYETRKPSRGALRIEWEQALIWICCTPAPSNAVRWWRIIFSPRPQGSRLCTLTSTAKI